MPKKRAASPAQIAANKANGLRSTGPKTPEGKARVSQNATTHGLCSEKPPAPCDLSQDTTLPNEQEEFEAVLAGLTHAHEPQTTTEAILIERLAQLNHRLRRSMRIETAMLDSNSNDVIAHRRRFPDPDTPKNDPKRTRDNWTLSTAYTRSSTEIHLLAHYESRLSRDFARTLTQLYGVKNLRNQTQEIPQRPQHPGTDLTVPSGYHPPSSTIDAPPRVDSPVCPPSPQSPNDAQVDSRQTNPSETPHQFATPRAVDPERTGRRVGDSQAPAPLCAIKKEAEQTNPIPPQPIDPAPFALHRNPADIHLGATYTRARRNPVMKPIGTILIALSLALALNAQNTPNKPKPTAPAKAAAVPRTPDNHPDLTGVYQPGTTVPGPWDEANSGTGLGGTGKNPNAPVLLASGDRTAGQAAPPYQPWAAAKVREEFNHRGVNDPAARCLPLGVPRTYSVSLFPIQIIQAPHHLIVYSEYMALTRMIPIIAKPKPGAKLPHRDDQGATYMGDSVAWWDGDTLVTDVTDFNDKTWLIGTGTLHTDKLHVTERFHRVSKDRMDYTAIMEDPGVLTGPWEWHQPFMLREGTLPAEYVCSENNLDPGRYEDLISKGVKIDRQ